MSQSFEAIKPNNAVDPLAGGGEMGARMRAFDWGQTPLGPVETWPQSLKTAVRIMLTSRQPIWLGWGRELIKLYNDPYKAIVGGKHPAALGQPASVVWREIWDEIEPMLHTAMGGVEGTYVEAQLLIMERNGYPEETYYTFSYSPIPNDEGGAGGIICANTDDTERVIGERQLALLRELAARTADARTFAAACAQSAEALATNLHDLPFALIVLAEPEQRRFVLAGTSGIDPNHPAAPATIAFDDDSTWPLTAVMAANAPQLITDLGARFGALPTGAWQRAPHQAVAVPISASGPSGKAAVLIVGLNPFRLFDERYQRFVNLVAGQIAASIANAQAYAEERRRAEILAELDRAKTDFFSNVSHEFRTPLTLMLGPAEDALADQDTSAANRERVAVIHRNALRLLKLVNTLLDFSRIEAGRTDASFAPTDVGALTADLASVFRSAFERAGVELVVDSPPLAAPVYLDRDMWEKIVFNLLSNALKFTFAGMVAVTVRQTDGAAELVVRDTGTGIPANELPHLFERFHRVKGARGRSFEGSGIGLALVQELVKLHGGTIRVTSMVDQGTTFTVSIPLGHAHLPADRIGAPRVLAATDIRGEAYVEEALRWLPDQSDQGSGKRDEVSDVSSRIPHPASRIPHPSARILLADDNADMRAYVARLLSQNYDVVAVADGEAALQATREQRFDLVLSDVMMPRLDGFGLIAALRADEHTRTLPVMLLSARAGEEARVEGMSAGADDYLLKPFSARELLVRVAARLEIARVRREAEAATRASESRLHHALEASRSGTWEYDPASRELVYDGEYGPLIGQPPGKGRVHAAALEGYTVEEDRLSGREAVRQALARGPGAEFETEYRLRVPGNPERWVYSRGQVVADEQGGLRMVGTLINITQRKQAEERLRLLQSVTTRLAETQTPAEVRRVILEDIVAALAANGGVVRRVTADGLVLDDYQPGAQTDDELLRGAMFVPLQAQHPAAEAVRTQQAVFIRDPADVTERYPALAEMVAGHSYPQASAHLPLKQGDDVFSLLTLGFAEPRAWDAAEQSFAIALADRAAVAYGRALLFEAERAARERAEESESRFRALSNAGVLGIITSDETGRIIDANPAFLAMLGLTHDDLAAGISWQDVTPPEWLERDMEADRQMKTQGAVASYEKEFFDRDGRRVPVLIGATLVGIDRRIGVGFVLDITERKRAEAAIRTAMEREQALRVQAEEASRLKDEFLATVSHELRTPLTAFLGYAQLLQSRKRDEPFVERTVAKMVRSATAQAQLIEDLLDVSRIASGKLRLAMQPTELGSVVLAALDMVRLAVDSKRLQLDVDLDPAAGAILGDPDRLQQVVWNLLSNATKFTSTGGTITIRLRDDGTHVQLTISDTGRGIAADFLPYVFDRFRQADSTTSRAHDGLGLGLAIVRHLVELHGGTVTAASDGVGQGATFTVRLPLLGTRAAPPRTSADKTLPTNCPPELRELRVLLVDDQEDILELLHEMLAPCGAVIKRCSSARDGLEALRTWRPDVLVSDIAMPRDDGYWLIRQVRALAPEDGGTTPSLALTAYVRMDDRLRVLAAGFQQYVPKPVEPDELRKVVAQLARTAATET
jgi:PAS domain S-box-containing protein